MEARQRLAPKPSINACRDGSRRGIIDGNGLASLAGGGGQEMRKAIKRRMPLFAVVFAFALVLLLEGCRHGGGY